jgi:hypothetical protein
MCSWDDDAEKKEAGAKTLCIKSPGLCIHIRFTDQQVFHLIHIVPCALIMQLRVADVRIKWRGSAACAYVPL